MAVSSALMTYHYFERKEHSKLLGTYGTYYEKILIKVLLRM